MGGALTEASPLSRQATELHQEATELDQEATELDQEATELHQEVHQESLLKDLREALAEQEKMKLTSAQLQHRIAEYLSRKKVCFTNEECGLIVDYYSRRKNRQTLVDLRLTWRSVMYSAWVC